MSVPRMKVKLTVVEVARRLARQRLFMEMSKGITKWRAAIVLGSLRHKGIDFRGVPKTRLAEVWAHDELYQTFDKITEAELQQAFDTERERAKAERERKYGDPETPKLVYTPRKANPEWKMQRDRDQLDAQRYRFVREHETLMWSRQGSRRAVFQAAWGGELDAKIDAEMVKAK